MPITKLINTAKTLGKLNAGLYLFNRVLSGLSRNWLRLFKYYVVIQPVPDKPLLPAHRGKNIVVRELTQFSQFDQTFNRPQAVIEARFAQQGRCFAAYQADECMGFIWLNFGAYQEDEVRCYFKPLPESQTSWDYDLYIDPKYRLSFAFPKLWDHTNALLRDQQRYWTVSRISAFNPGSLTSHARLGAKIVGYSVFICLGGVQIMLGNLKPNFHVSVHRQSWPTIYVDADKLMPRVKNNS